MDFTQTFESENGIRNYNFYKCVLYLQLQGRKLYGSSFHIHPSQRTQLRKLLAFAAKDVEACIFYGIDLQKGLLVTGPASSGKTSLLHLLKPFFEPERRYLIRSCRELLYCYNLFGGHYLKRYTENNVPYCFDDLGVVPSCIGTELNLSVVREVLQLRLSINPATTHIATRMTTEELVCRYGKHFAELLLHKLNIVEFTEPFILK